MNRWLGHAWRWALLVALYFAGSVVAVFFLRTPSDVTLFWPAAGIGFAAVVRYGLWYATALPVATLLVHSLVVPVPEAFLPYSIASNALATALGGWYVRRRVPVIHLRSADGFLLLRGSLLVSVVSAAVGVAGMVQARMVAAHDAPGAMLQWALGDLLGLASIAPLGLYLIGGGLAGPSPHRSRASTREIVMWAFLLLAMLWLVYAISLLGTRYPLAVASLPLALLLWSTTRYPPIVTLVSTSAVIICVALMTGLGLGGFERPSTLHDSALMMGMLVLFAIIPVLLLASRQEHAHAMAALHQRATRDTLTGLLNRDAFEEQARQQLGTSLSVQTLMYVDIDHFKLVNDSASHVAGDEMIRGIGTLFLDEFGEDALMARTGGDEFAVLAPVDESAAMTRARRLLAAIEKLRVAWQGQNLGTTGSIGLATSQPPHLAFDQLLTQADAACFAAKELGGNRAFAAASNPDDIRDRTRAMHSAIAARDALDHRRFALWCQPIVDLRNPGPAQSRFETLVRWIDADGNLRPPADVIVAAERYRMGPRLDRHVLDAILTWLEQHPEDAAHVASFGVNIGGTTLVDEDFCDYVAARLKRSTVRPGQLCLEITETSVVRDMTRARRFIGRLRELGCRFALDDFGTGFCSFGYLRGLDVDYLKIDGSFVRDLGNGPLPEAVVRSITDIAHLLDKQAVAEQVETEEQLQLLHDMGLDFAQGYAFQRAQPIEEFFASAEWR